MIGKQVVLTEEAKTYFTNNYQLSNYIGVVDRKSSEHEDYFIVCWITSDNKQLANLYKKEHLELYTPKELEEML